MITLTTKQFTYNKNFRRLTCEYSDLPPTSEFMYQVYLDACDVGFRIASVFTGVELVFVNTYRKWSEGDYLWDEFRPMRAINRHLTDQQWDDVRDLNIVIFND